MKELKDAVLRWATKVSAPRCGRDFVLYTIRLWRARTLRPKPGTAVRVWRASVLGAQASQWDRWRTSSRAQMRGFVVARSQGQWRKRRCLGTAESISIPGLVPVRLLL